MRGPDIQQDTLFSTVSPESRVPNGQVEGVERDRLTTDADAGEHGPIHLGVGAGRRAPPTNPDERRETD